MRLAKKGEGQTLTQSGTELLISLLLVGVMAFLLKHYFAPQLHTTETLVDPAMRHQLIVERLLNTCFVTQDPQLGRTYPGIDLSRFTLDQLDSCFPEKPFAGVKITDFITQQEQTLLETSPALLTTYTLLYQGQQKHPGQLTLYLREADAS